MHTNKETGKKGIFLNELKEHARNAVSPKNRMIENKGKQSWFPMAF